MRRVHRSRAAQFQLIVVELSVLFANRIIVTKEYTQVALNCYAVGNISLEMLIDSKSRSSSTVAAQTKGPRTDVKRYFFPRISLAALFENCNLIYYRQLPVCLALTCERQWLFGLKMFSTVLRSLRCEIHI